MNNLSKSILEQWINEIANISSIQNQDRKELFTYQRDQKGQEVTVCLANILITLYLHDLARLSLNHDCDKANGSFQSIHWNVYNL